MVVRDPMPRDTYTALESRPRRRPDRRAAPPGPSPPSLGPRPRGWMSTSEGSTRHGGTAMRAAVFAGPRSIEVADRPDPLVVAPTDAVVRVVLGCVCGSD